MFSSARYEPKRLVYRDGNDRGRNHLHKKQVMSVIYDDLVRSRRQSHSLAKI